jgi:hypothetical protein
MGQVITRNAGTDRIINDISKTITNANARGGEVQSLTAARLSAIHSALLTIDQQWKQACANGDVLHANLMARDGESDLEIGAVIDEIWNTLGRPAQSADYDLIVGPGKKAWTDGDPAKQHHAMGVLAANIRNANNAKLADKKEAWAVRIEQKAAVQKQAAEPIDASDAQVTTLGMQRRTLTETGQVSLVRLKRDFKNLGMTEAQIHEIIPDNPTTSSVAAPNPAPQPTSNTQPAPSTQTAPNTQPASITGTD